VKPIDDTDDQSRSAALQTADSILLLRQRAERELIQAKEALERKTEELALSLSMMRATLESTTDGIVVTDMKGKVTGFNGKYMEMLGFSRELMESLEAEPLRELFSRQFKDPKQFLARVKEIYASAPPETFDVLHFADGRVFERYSKIQRIENRSVGRVWSFRDITERKRAEEKLRASEEQFRLLVETVEEYAIYMLDASGHVVSWNSGAERIKQYSSNEIVGKNYECFFTDEDVAAGKPRRLLEQARKEGHVRDQGRLVRKDGSSFEGEVVITAIRDTAGIVQGFSQVTRDISDQILQERVNEAAKNAAERASKAKDDFLAVLSHELRTPLTPALAAATYLAEHKDLLPEFRAEVVAISRNVKLEARLIDDLLDLTRITSGKIALRREIVDAHALFGTALQIAREDMHAKEIEFVMDLAATDHHVWADPVRIQQVFWNLLNNAVKFTNRAGRITVRSSNERGRFLFEITDTGIGIEPEQQGRIFQAFEQGERTTTRQFGGLGLGLTISKTLMDLHGGSLSVQSEGKHRGATFRVTLDALKKPAPASPSAADGRTGSTRSLQLLLVDDHADTRFVLSRLLEKSGHRVACAHSVEEALKLLEKERFDALISDIGLPDRSGYELISEAKQHQPLRGVALSGFGMEEDVRRSLEAGFDYHLTKPIDFHELQSLLERIASET
jgi:PAS domain S-box-containing protein